MTTGDGSGTPKANWDFSVFTFGTIEPSGPERITPPVVEQIRLILQSEGVPENKIEKIKTYPFLSDLVGGSVHDDLTSLVATGGPAENYATVGEAFQFVINNRDWIYLAAVGGVIGNRADAAVMGVVGKLSELRELRDLPALSLQNANIRAKKALVEAFYLPPGTFETLSQMQQADDSWILTYHFVPAISSSHNDGWLYTVNVRRPNAGKWARDKLAVVHVGRSRI